MKAQKFLSLVNTVLGVILILAPFVLFPVCASTKPDGTPMGCWYSGVFIGSMGVVVVVLSLLALRGKVPALSFVLSAVAAAMGWLAPHRVIPVAGEGWACGLCGNPEHACRAVTMPAVGWLVVAVVLVSVVALILNFVQGKR